jgi:hypothetical protein
MSSASESVAGQMAERVGELLASFSPDQRESAMWPFPSDDERTLWFYTPTDHGGLPLTEMTSVQHRLVHRLLGVALSTPGYNTASVILGQENILDQVEGFGVDFGRERGRDPLLYWIAVFGQPGLGTWGWRFGGHHISLHFTMAGGRVVSSTPCFMGADPASVALLGPHLHRPLGGVEDLGRDLVHSLDPAQRVAALRSPSAPADLVTSNRALLSEGDEPLPLPLIWRGRFEGDIDNLLVHMQHQTDKSLGFTPDLSQALSFSTQPKGVAAGDLGSGQREILRELLLTYVGRINDNLADEQMAKVDAGFDDLHFLWAGGTEVGVPHYYRVQGGDLLAEYDNAQRAGNHVHTVWRDLSHDFGGDPLAEHYAQANHHH